MRFTLHLGLVLITLAITRAGYPGEIARDDPQDAAAVALDSLVAELAADRPANAAAYAERLQVYLAAHPAFYGAAAALLDATGSVTESPYVHRSEDGYRALDLAQPEYRIDDQDWVRMPLDADAGIWTPPYFDAGGGEIWMITRAVPARDSGGVFAVVTTDLPVEPPASAVEPPDR